jgi:hypothetical protein
MFILDNLLLNFIKNLFSNYNIQFAALVGTWIAAELAFQNKRMKR